MHLWACRIREDLFPGALLKTLKNLSKTQEVPVLRRSEAMSWVLSSGKSLSLTQFGSRVVQPGEVVRGGE